MLPSSSGRSSEPTKLLDKMTRSISKPPSRRPTTSIAERYYLAAMMNGLCRSGSGCARSIYTRLNNYSACLKSKVILLLPFSDAALETVIGYARQLSSPLTAVLLFQLGGAISRVDEQAIAAGNRDAEFVLNIQSPWLEASESQRHMQWTREFWTAMRPFSTGGVYMNFLSMDEGEERVRAAYGANYKRLVTIKNNYDPTNLFRVNHNIKPA